MADFTYGDVRKQLADWERPAFTYNPLFSPTYGTFLNTFNMGQKEGRNGNLVFRPKGSQKTYNISPDLVPAIQQNRQIATKLFGKPQGSNPVKGDITIKDLTNIQAGDPTYFDDSVKHMKSLPIGFSNYIINRPERLAGYGDKKIPMTYIPWASGGFFTSDGSLVFDPRYKNIKMARYIPEGSVMVGGMNPDLGLKDKMTLMQHRGKGVTSNTPALYRGGSSGDEVSDRGSVGGHEGIHWMQLMGLSPFRPSYKQMFMSGLDIDPYSQLSYELSQSSAIYNRNRNALRLRFSDPQWRQRYIAAGYTPQQLDTVINMPRFYSTTPQRKQSIKDLRYLRKNPELIPLFGNEAARHISNAHQTIEKYDRFKPTLDKLKAMPEWTRKIPGLSWLWDEANQAELNYKRLEDYSSFANRGNVRPAYTGAYSQGSTQIG